MSFSPRKIYAINQHNLKVSFNWLISFIFFRKLKHLVCQTQKSSSQLFLKIKMFSMRKRATEKFFFIPFATLRTNIFSIWRLEIKVARKRVDEFLGRNERSIQIRLFAMVVTTTKIDRHPPGLIVSSFLRPRLPGGDEKRVVSRCGSSGHH